MIREIEDKDFQDVKEIFKEVHELHVQNRPDIFKNFSPFTKKFFKKIKDDPNSNIIVCEEEGKIKGFVLFEIVEHNAHLTKKVKILKINVIAVKSEFQNMGIGTKLIEHLKNLKEKEKINFINLNVWSFNNKALNFYLKNGFKVKRTDLEII